MHAQILHDVAVSPNLVNRHPVACFAPSVCVLRDGAVLVVHRHGATKHSQDGVLVAQRSEDRGATWSEPAIVYNGLTRSPLESVLTGMAGVATDGTALGLGGSSGW